MSSLCVVCVEGLVDGWHIDKNIDNLYADYYYYYYYNRDQITKPYTWTVFAFHDSNTGVLTELCVSCVYSCTFWVLVCWWRHFDCSFARLTVPVVTTTSITLSSNKIQNGDILVPTKTRPPGKWPLKRRVRVWTYSIRTAELSRLVMGDYVPPICQRPN